MQMQFFPESDVAGVPICCRIYNINMKISNAWKDPLAMDIPTYIHRGKRPHCL
jgi:hypothetical protein